MLNNRSVVELIAIAFTGLIVFSVLFGSIAVAVVEIVNPEADTTGVVDALSSVITGILGALLGLLAGKSEALSQKSDE